MGKACWGGANRLYLDEPRAAVTLSSTNIQGALRRGAGSRSGGLSQADLPLFLMKQVRTGAFGDGPGARLGCAGIACKQAVGPPKVGCGVVEIGLTHL